ncbi:hypothetical protein [Streptomyces sp. CC208A]|uniref:hypothetical protein n=1 Tax=Streptomyces sp. CC208A TaxID=3044573 RepID=UPI0024A8EFCD|nr:hypothetical protein [Streptomyces sp. CC208A]
MLRHVIAPSAAYTKVSHSVVRNPRLTSDAKVLLVYLQGLPENVAAAKPLGEHAVDLGMKPRAYQRAKESLVACGHLHEWRWQGGRGRWITEQLVTNVTLTRDEAAAVRNGDRSPTVAGPTVGGPAAPESGGSPTDEDGEKTNRQPPGGPTPPTDPEEPGGLPQEQQQERQAQERDEEDPALVHAERLLLTLHHTDRDLRLGVREARGLAAIAAEWLRRGVSAADLRHALTAHLPRTGVRSAVGFLRHRLTEKLPPEPVEALPGEAPGAAPGPLVTCQGTGDKPHAFRPVADETVCGPCRREAALRAEPPARRPEGRPARPDWRDLVAEAFAERPGLAWAALDRAAGAGASGA